jgi:hypothetical protein
MREASELLQGMRPMVVRPDMITQIARDGFKVELAPGLLSSPESPKKKKRGQFLLYSKKNQRKRELTDTNCNTIDDKNQEQRQEEERYDASIFAVFEKVHDGQKKRKESAIHSHFC